MSYNETTKFCTADEILADNWYEILGCNTKSTQEEIEQSYRKLAKQYHPDKNSDPSALRMFYRINEAHKILGDREVRAFYDFESGNASNVSNYRFQVKEDVIYFKTYIDQLTGYRISEQNFKDDIWNLIQTKFMVDKSEFKRNLNIIGTLDISKKSLEQGIRTAFPVYRYKTCGVCRGAGKIGIDTRDICYNCDGFGIEEEKIYAYAEIPKKWNAEKLFKIPGRGHKVPIGIGDLIIKINVTSRFGMKTKILHSAFKNKNINKEKW